MGWVKQLAVMEVRESEVRGLQVWELLGSVSGDNENSSYPKCYAVWTGVSVRRILVPSS
jgi:hypothetical protein